MFEFNSFFNKLPDLPEEDIDTVEQDWGRIIDPNDLFSFELPNSWQYLEPSDAPNAVYKQVWLAKDSPSGVIYSVVFEDYQNILESVESEANNGITLDENRYDLLKIIAQEQVKGMGLKEMATQFVEVFQNKAIKITGQMNTEIGDYYVNSIIVVLNNNVYTFYSLSPSLEITELDRLINSFELIID